MKNRFIVNKPYITKQEDEVIKKTAQYATILGVEFIKEIAQKEMNNPSFSFLHQDDSNYPYFKQLCDSYNRIIKENTKYEDFLMKMQDQQTSINYSIKRAEKESEVEKKKKEQMEKKQKENELFNSIDWNDFIIVEEIRFDDDTTPALYNNEHNEVEANENEEEMNAVQQNNDVVIEDLPVQKKKKEINQPVQECPFCHKFIPVNDYNEHIKIELSSKGKKQTPQSKKYNGNVLADNDEIAKNLDNLASKRKDWD